MVAFFKFLNRLGFFSTDVSTYKKLRETSATSNIKERKLIVITKEFTAKFE